ncbi:Smr protein/MutS2-like protein [uncultured Alphaproteobacteria bacterium]|uniref:Smr protein/MutS2-like protein n=1 Tax=uncultured Alphaproteobacteria bacterium TaxID=91750 RepID=A0A212KB88_9PROT|nr:Smr protein/MutS2-like protein [uncultured Alphaproteobacteria bacterium]
MGRKRPPPITAEDARLWAQVTRDAKPLGDAPRPEIAADPPRPPDDEPPGFDLPGPRLPAMRPAPGAVRRHAILTHGSTANIDKRTAERFKKGEMQIEARLDLHGLTREAAHDALQDFMRDSFERGRRCVIVVTGKGRRSDGVGILRSEVPRWLNEAQLRPLILSFAYAQPRDGGEGALYVFLRRERER